MVFTSAKPLVLYFLSYKSTILREMLANKKRIEIKNNDKPIDAKLLIGNEKEKNIEPIQPIAWVQIIKFFNALILSILSETIFSKELTKK